MRILLLFSLSLMVLGCQKPSEQTSKPTPPAEAKPSFDIDFSDFKTTNKILYGVSPRLATLCRMPQPWEGITPFNDTAERRGPHAHHFINVKVSPKEFDAFASNKPLPAGTVIIKEKLFGSVEKNELAAIAAMIKKQPGYDPTNGDWEFVFKDLKAEGQPVNRGKLTNCIDCHRKANETNKENDFLFRYYVADMK